MTIKEVPSLKNVRLEGYFPARKPEKPRFSCGLSIGAETSIVRKP